MNRLIRSRLGLWKSRDYGELINQYEKDVVINSTMDHERLSPEDRSATYRQTVELIRLGQLRRARQTICTKGCSDPTLPHVVEQMKTKFPKRKELKLFFQLRTDHVPLNSHSLYKVM